MRWLRIAAGLLGLAPAMTLADAGDHAPPYSAVFDKAFEPGFIIESSLAADGEAARNERVVFRTVDAGTLTILSNHICASDPFVALGDTPAFTELIPNGAHPVRLAVGDFPFGGHRVAFARVDFSTEPAVRWQMATVAGQDLATLKPDELFGYGVDAGTGSFYDPQAGDAGKALLEANPDAWQQWQTDGEATGGKVIGPSSFLLSVPMGNANVVMFHSGWGDGFYASYFGYDAAGNVTALVTDFATIDWRTAKW